MKPILVVVPSYKPGNYVYDCLGSLAAQNLCRDLYDVLVVLNGPKGVYYHLLGDFVEKNKNFYLSYSEKQGVSYARNFGIEFAVENHYEYLAFIDDDDIVSSNYLKNLYLDPRLDIVISNVLHFSNHINESVPSYLTRAFEKGVTGDLFADRKFFSATAGKMIKVSCIKDIRFPHVIKGEDSIFFAMLTKNIRNIGMSSSDTVYYVRERGGSLSRKKQKLIHKVQLYLYLICFYYLPMLGKGYDVRFILSRIVASIVHILR